MQLTPESHVVFQLARPERKLSVDWSAWASAWPDALAFVVGLAVAAWAGWTATDLVWSLWLSSLVVGYATIVCSIAIPAVVFSTLAYRERNNPANSSRDLSIILAITLGGAAFLLAFFTVHFGGFHFVQAGLFLHFFPIDVPGVANPEMGGKAVYLEIVRRYWFVLPSAFLSHRAAFMRTPITLDPERFFKSFIGDGTGPKHFFLEPYRNVLRMHGLIFFFGFAHFAGLENFAVYTVIYAVYFFPWRLVRIESSTA
jgi:hypothetical protein